MVRAVVCLLLFLYIQAFVLTFQVFSQYSSVISSQSWSPNSMRRHTKQNSNKRIWSSGSLWSVFENLQDSCLHHISNQSASQSVLGLQALPSSVSQSSSLRRAQLTYELKPCNFNFYSTPLHLLEWPCCAVRGGLGTLAFFMLGLIPVTAHSAGKSHRAVIIIWLEMLWSIM